MSIRIATATTIAVTLFSLPAHAQQLPPDVYGALSELFQTANYLCQNGLQVSCQTAVAIDQQAANMTHAYGACQQGDAGACNWYQQAVTQVAIAYQQTYAQQQPMTQGQPFDTTAMTQQHQQNMTNLQQQFNAGQQQYQQQQQLNDQMFDNYMGTLR